jgi:large subunit ribosomal protein L2
MPLSAIPLGVEIHNIELYPGKGGKIVKSAGSTATIIAKDDKYADVKLPSKEVRKILLNCMATIGRISNVEHKLENLGKAGRSRHMGIRPTVRGVAQNPRSHPHGGGEGKSGQGMHPKTPWGKSARGTRTRKPKYSDALIVKRRSK